MLLTQGTCEKCEDRGDFHGSYCLIRKLIFSPGPIPKSPSKDQLMELAVQAIQNYRSPTPMNNEKSLSPSQNQNVQSQNQQLATIEHVLIGGDLGKLTPEQRVMYLQKVCDSLGLNPMTRPFEYIVLNNKLTLYARKDATEQLRKIHHVSIPKLEREVIEGVYTVTAYAELPDGRKDSSTGAVAIDHLKGDAKANAMMKAETKSKRRVTLSICGLGMLDESEVESIPNREEKSFDQPPAQPSNVKILSSGGGRKPTEAQLKRLYAITKSCGLEPAEVKTYIFSEWEVESSKDLSLSQYDQLCADLESGEVHKYIDSKSLLESQDTALEKDVPEDLFESNNRDPRMVK